MTMFIMALICGLNGCGWASAARGSSGCCWAMIFAGQVAIASTARTAGTLSSGKIFRMAVPLPRRPCGVRLCVAGPSHPERPDDGADQDEHDKPMAAIDPH